MNRALLVGINNYPAPNQLHGCVNDVNDMAHFLVSNCGFKSQEIRLLVDKRATAHNILTRLGWLLNGLKKGDRIVFHYSGHGAQVASRNPQGEADRLDEVICPVDFNFDDRNTMIRDKDFVRLFGNVPDGVEFIWISDSCFSGGLSKKFIDMPKNVKDVQRKTFELPADILWRNKAAKDSNKMPLTMKGAAKELGVALISGCTEEQESADASIDGKFNGALTYYLLKTLQSGNGLKMHLNDLIKDVVEVIKQNKFDQTPELLGSKTIAKHSFLEA